MNTIEHVTANGDSAGLRVQRFSVGDKVRCHADCTGYRPARGAAIILTEHHCFDGELLLARGDGWWLMSDPLTHSGQSSVHEQELELLPSANG